MINKPFHLPGRKTLFDFFRNFISPENNEDLSWVRLIRGVLTVATLAMVGLAILEFVSSPTNLGIGFPVVIALTLLSGTALFFSYRNVYWPGRLLVPLSAFFAITFLAITSDGLHDSSVVGFSLVIILTALLAGRRAIPGATVLTLLGILTVGYADLTGINRSVLAQRTGWFDVAVICVIQIIAAAALNGVMTRLNSALEASRANEAVLEQRVAERTKALATSTEVSRRLSTILDQNTLVKEVVEQLQKAFNYYHAHIYLVEATSGDLIMAGGTGEAGQAMLSKGHRVSKGKGLVGRAAEMKEIILVPDTSKDPDWLPNPLLPETKSEIAVPILTGERVLGVLDVQNNVVASLGQQDADLIRSIASQAAVALQNSSLYARAEASMQEARSLVEYAPEAIVVVDLETGCFTEPNDNAVKLYGLPREELVKVGPAQMSPPTQPDGRDSTEKALMKIGEAMEGKAPIFEWVHRNGQGQDIPCEVRLVRIPGEHPRVRASVTDITERKRMEELTRRGARQQETLNFITQEIQKSTTVEAALQIAARELGRAAGMKPTLITLDPSALAGEHQVAIKGE